MLTDLPTNLPQNLELAAKVKSYGVEILIDESQVEQVKGMAYLEIDLIHMNDHEDPVRIYTVVGDEEYAQTEAFKEWKVTHESMLAAYRVMDFDCAAQDCKDARAFAPEAFKTLYELYSTRISVLYKNPPPEGWNGVYFT